MRASFLSFILLTSVSFAPGGARTYLLSVTNIALQPGERVQAIRIKTFGVTFKAICKLPLDWEVTAGSMGTSGRIDGDAGHGVSMLGKDKLGILQDMVLIDVAGPVSERAKKIPDGEIPATFSGEIKFSAYQNGKELEPRRPLDPLNFRIVPASRCP